MFLYKNKSISLLVTITIFIVVGIVAYGNSLSSAFHADDFHHIVSNPFIRHADDAAILWNALVRKTEFLPYYSFSWNYSFHQLNVAGYHWVNVCLHIGMSLSVLWFVWLILLISKQSKVFSEDQKYALALFSGLAFLVHPLQTEAVIYLSQRGVLLGAFFYLLTMCFYIKGRVGSRWFMALSGLMFVLGIFSHAMVVTLPLMLLFLEWVFFQRVSVKNNRSNFFKLLICSAVALGLTIFLSLNSLGKNSGVFKFIISELPVGNSYAFGTYWLTQFKVFWLYLKLWFVPFGQNFQPDISILTGIWNSWIFLSVGMILGFIVLLKKLGKRADLVVFSGLWIFVTFMGMNAVSLKAQLMAEHQFYLVNVAVVFLFVVILFTIVRNQKVFRWICFIIICLLSSLTIERGAVWKSEATLWGDVIQKSSRSSQAYVYLSADAMAKGEQERALHYLKKATAIDPQNMDAHTRVGLIYLNRNELVAAKVSFEKAIAIDRSRAFPFNNLGVVYLLEKDYKKAEDAFSQAMGNQPSLLEPRLNLIKVYKATENYSKALNIYNRLMLLYPDNEKVLVGLAELYILMDQPEKVSQVAKHISISLKKANDLASVGNLFAQNHYVKEAELLYQKSLQIDPANLRSYKELGKLYVNIGDYNQALNIWRQGLVKYPREEELLLLIKRIENVGTGSF